MDELLKQLELLQKSNENLTNVVSALNERINLTNKRCDLLFEYCKKLKEGIEISMGS